MTRIMIFFLFFLFKIDGNQNHVANINYQITQKTAQNNTRQEGIVPLSKNTKSFYVKIHNTKGIKDQDHNLLTDPPNSYENIANDLSDAGLYHLDLRKIHLTKDQLDQIFDKIQDSNVGHITWGTLPHGVVNLVNKIESKIIQNNRKFKRYPSDFIHGVLSLHTYFESKEGTPVEFDNASENVNYNPHLASWKIHKIFTDKKSGYYSVLYVNKKDRQAVLAHRGTTIQLADLVKSKSPIQADIKGVLEGEIVSQQSEAFLSTQYAVQYVQENHYNLSITGHSLGAWFAELSVYYCHRDFSYPEARAVTFDSPGSVLSIKEAKSNIINRMTDFNVNTLDIVTYLSAPNFINTCNQHIGRVYRIFPHVPKADLIKNLGFFIQKIPIIRDNLFFLWGFLSISGHSLKFLLSTFDPISGKPKIYENVLDWPRIEYIKNPKNEKNLLALIPGSILADKISLPGAPKFVSDTTIFSVVSIIAELANGNIKQKQYWNTFKYIDNNPASQGYSIKTSLSGSDQFSLKYEGHYKTQKMDPLKEPLFPVKGSTDWYLDVLAKNQFNFDGLTGRQLDELKSTYTVERMSDGNDYISSTIPVEDIREQMARLIKVNPEIKKNFLTYANDYINLNSKSHTCENLVSNIPLERLECFGRESVFKKIDEALENCQSVALSGFQGIGKTVVALEYAYRQEGVGKVVRWIDAHSKIKVDEEYRKLAIELGINIKSLDSEMIVRLVNNSIDKIRVKFLFIYDRVREYDEIKKYLTSLPKSVKILLTTNKNNLNDSIKSIKLDPITDRDARLYIKENLSSNISDREINGILEVTGLFPHEIIQAVAYIKKNRLFKGGKNIKEIRNYILNNKKNTQTRLLFNLLFQDSAHLKAWRILEYLAYLDPDFISLSLIKDLTGLNDENLRNSIKILDDLSLINLTIKNEIRGVSIHTIVQEEIIKYKKNFPQNSIPENEYKSHLLKTLNVHFPEVESAPSENWKQADLIEDHVQKVLAENWDTSQQDRIDLYIKISKYNKYVTRNYNLCLEYEKKALSIKETLFQNNRAEIAKSLHNIGHTYYLLTNYENSLIFYNKALEIWRRLKENNDLDLAECLYRIGKAYFKCGKLTEALNSHEEARKKYELIYQGKHINVIKILKALGTDYSDINPKKSLVFLKNSLTMAKDLYPLNVSKITPILSSILNSLGYTYLLLNNSAEALDCLEQSLKIKEIYQENHPTIPSTLNHLGLVYEILLNEPHKALLYYERGLKINQRLYPDTSSKISESLNYLGRAYIKLGSGKKALESFKKGLEIQVDSSERPLKASLLRNMGYIYLDYLNKPKEALTYYQEALKLAQEAYSKPTLSLAHIVMDLGVACRELHKNQEAIKLLEQSLKMYCDILGETNYLIAKNLYELGAAYGKIEDKAKEAAYYNQAYKMYASALGQTHLKTLKVKYAIDKISTVPFKNLENKNFIFERGETDEITILIKEKIQSAILNPIQSLASLGTWKYSGIYFWRRGVVDYLQHSLIQKEIGSLFSPEAMKTALMLCFESIILGILQNSGNDPVCLREYAKIYPELIKEINETHPEYFLDKAMRKNCMGQLE